MAKGQRVYVESLAFNVERNDNCTFDWLEIRDGNDSNADILGSRKCGNNIFDPIVSTGNTIHLHFHTDGLERRSGFQLQVHIYGMY